MVRISLFVLAMVCMLAPSLTITQNGSAHEERKVGSYQVAVGWADEPTYVGFKNAVEMFLKDTKGKPVLNLGDTLKVEVVFGDQKSGLLTVEPALDVDESFCPPRRYLASLTRTRSGVCACFLLLRHI